MTDDLHYSTIKDVLPGTLWRNRRWHSRGTCKVVKLIGTEVFYENERGARLSSNVQAFVRLHLLEGKR